MALKPYFSINFNRAEMERFLADMANAFNASVEQIERAKVTALNAVSAGMYKAGRDLVVGRYALKKPNERYKKSVFLLKANKSRQYLVFRAEGRVALPLSEFKTRFSKRRGVSVQVLKDGAMTPLQKIMESNGHKRVYKAFLMPGANSGKELVASRDPGLPMVDGREAVRALYGPGLVPFLGKDENKDFLLESTFERFKARFVHDLESILAGRMQAVRKR